MDGDFSALDIIAESLLQVQAQYGIIPNIRSKGHCARKILQKMMALRASEEGEKDKYCARSEIDLLVM